MPRKNHNVKNRVRAEEECIDIDLKAAGLYEEGLTFQEKQQLLKLIADSKNSAEEEETRRLEKTPGTSSGLLGVESKKILQIEEDVDSDPVITFESPASRLRKPLISSPNCVNKVLIDKNKETELSLKQTLIPIENNEKSVQNNMLIRQINSLLSNNSITIQYSSPSSKKTTVNENIVLESDDENCDPLILNTEDGSTNEEISPNKDGQNGEQCDIVALDEGKISSPEVKICKESKTNKPNNYKSVPSSCSQKFQLNSESIEQCLNSISLSEHSVEKKSVGSSGVKINNNKSLLLKPKENIPFNAFQPLFGDNTTLKHKIKLLSEKQNQAYIKAAYETETKCVKRIYSLIENWQLALTEFQSSNSISCKWSSPITVDRQIKTGILKKSYINQISSTKSVNTKVCTSGTSTDSDNHISDKSSDEDFNIFPSKIKSKTIRKTYSRNAKISNNLNINKNEDIDCDKRALIDSSNQEDVEINKERKRTMTSPAVPTSSITENEDLFLEQDSCAQNSQSLLDSPSTSLGVRKNNFYSKNIKRKSFKICQDDVPERASGVDSNSSDLPASPLIASEEIVKGENKVANNEEVEVSITTCEDHSQASNSLADEDKVLKRSSIKRKCISNPLNMPPLKRSAVSNEHDCDVDEGVVPVFSRFRSSKILNDDENCSSISLSTQNIKSSKNEHTSTNPATVTKGKEETTEEIENMDIETLDEEEETKNDESKATERSVTFIECPLCQKDFIIHEIEAHASECNGPIEETPPLQERPSRSISLSQPSHTGN